MNTAKIVGYLKGEPIYSLDAMPVEQTDKGLCLPCLLNNLIEPSEELEAFAEDVAARLRSLREVRIDSPETDLYVTTEMRQLRLELAMASEAVVTIKAVLATAAEVL